MNSPTPAPDLVLASKSPRRRELLQQLGLRVATVAVSVTEVVGAAEDPLHYNLRVAEDKARAGWAGGAADRPVLGADTEVVLGQRVFGKPATLAAAADMLRDLADRTHQVVTAVAVIRRDGELRSIQHSSDVTFGPLDERQIEACCQSGEPLDKAGGYAIQGLAAALVRHLDGSFSGVMGLPLYETAALLCWAGVQSPILGSSGLDERLRGALTDRTQRC